MERIHRHYKLDHFLRSRHVPSVRTWLECAWPPDIAGRDHADDRQDAVLE